MGVLTPVRLPHFRAACCTIQRVYRGHLGRVKSGNAREERAMEQESSVYHYYATVIQRVFNGYYSRKYIHDFFARKAYIESIKEKSQQLREQLSGHMEKQIEVRHADRCLVCPRLQTHAGVERICWRLACVFGLLVVFNNMQAEQIRAEEAARDEFKKVTQNLHHLLSTKSTPGVYNPPYAQDMVPTAFDVPIEEHLREGVKEVFRTTGLRRVKPAPYTEASRLSVQVCGCGVWCVLVLCCGSLIQPTCDHERRRHPSMVLWRNKSEHRSGTAASDTCLPSRLLPVQSPSLCRTCGLKPLLRVTQEISRQGCVVSTFPRVAWRDVCCSFVAGGSPECPLAPRSRSRGESQDPHGSYRTHPLPRPSAYRTRRSTPQSRTTACLKSMSAVAGCCVEQGP